jgi:hypothetical protein
MLKGMQLRLSRISIGDLPIVFMLDRNMYIITKSTGIIISMILVIIITVKNIIAVNSIGDIFSMKNVRAQIGGLGVKIVEVF